MTPVSRSLPTMSGAESFTFPSAQSAWITRSLTRSIGRNDYYTDPRYVLLLPDLQRLFDLHQQRLRHPVGLSRTWPKYHSLRCHLQAMLGHHDPARSTRSLSSLGRNTIMTEICSYRHSPECTGWTLLGYFIPETQSWPEVTVTTHRIVCRPCLEYIILRDTR